MKKTPSFKNVDLRSLETFRADIKSMIQWKVTFQDANGHWHTFITPGNKAPAFNIRNLSLSDKCNVWVKEDQIEKIVPISKGETVFELEDWQQRQLRKRLVAHIGHDQNCATFCPESDPGCTAWSRAANLEKIFVETMQEEEE